MFEKKKTNLCASYNTSDITEIIHLFTNECVQIPARLQKSSIRFFYHIEIVNRNVNFIVGTQV